MYNIHLYALIIMANISEIGNWGSEYELSTYSVEMDKHLHLFPPLSLISL